MRFSMIRAGVVATSAAIALAACGGHGLVPSQSAVPVGDSITPMSKVHTCATKPPQPAWIFKGACVIKKLPPKGTKFALPQYAGITATASFPKSTAKLSTFVIVDAVYKFGDIKSYKGKAFPKFTSSVLKSLVYIQAINGAKKGIKFTKGNLKFTVTAKKFPGKNCNLSYLAKTSKGYSWTATPLAGGVVSGAVSITVPSSLLATLFSKTGGALPPGPLYLNVSCH